MQKVYFHNPGQLDIRGATTMGLSAKDTEDAIGKFGTGLKYSIASILRWGGSISIQTGASIYTFGLKNISFRNKDHQQIYMTHPDGREQELGYTTHYGSHWEPWQIFRELYSNAKDEGGDVSCAQFELDSVPYAGEDSTLITVHCPKVAECYHERDTIILPSPGVTNAGSCVFQTHMLKQSSEYLYYRNVRVRDRVCLYTWNLFEGISLTEDRSIDSTFYYEAAVSMYIQASNDFDFIARVLRAPEYVFEGCLSYSQYYTSSDQFLQAARELYRAEGKGKLPSGVWSILVAAEPALGDPTEVKLSKIQQQQLTRAIELVARMGYPQVHEYPISVVDFHKNTLGQYKNGKIMLSPQVFEQGTKQVVSTLFEEVLHAETGLKDCTYEMQTRLFNMLVSMYEEHVFGEAC